ncbi:hypothetical protein L6452_01189 [Arctium lappa]|uniref:Uncharacterized protein n=1 Tax=Arctium lappa TaxID=4217 RepID=A0ACB9FGM7_ARCLA|nr:hypothetical protein L6452_01189 [Arctium lappa]
MDDSRSPTEDIFPSNEIFVNDILRGSNTVHTEIVEDEDGFRMHSSEELSVDEERDDDLNLIGGESGYAGHDIHLIHDADH